MLEIFKFLQKVNLEGNTQHAVITHANTFNGIKISWGGGSLGMMLNLSNAPYKTNNIQYGNQASDQVLD